MYWFLNFPIDSIAICSCIPIIGMFGALVGTRLGINILRKQIKNKQLNIQENEKLDFNIALIGIIIGGAGSFIWAVIMFIMYSAY